MAEGFGEAGFVSSGSVLNYKVEFENDPEWANAPVRWVRVFDTLAEEFDLDTFELKSICIAGNYIEVGDGRDSYNELRELSIKGEKVLTQISVNLDYETRQILAEFTAIDPETGWMLQDVLRGIQNFDFKMIVKARALSTVAVFKAIVRLFKSIGK